MFCCMAWVINAMFLLSTRWLLIGKAINNKRSKMSSRPTRRPKTTRRKKSRNKTSFNPHPKTDFHPTPRIFNGVRGWAKATAGVRGSSETSTDLVWTFVECWRLSL